MSDCFALKDVTYGYRAGIQALDGVTLNIPEGSRFAVIGSNGSGKSTLFQVLAGLIEPTSGTVVFRDRPLNADALGRAEFVRYFRGSVGYVFQDPDVQLFCPTVMDELTYGPLHLGLTDDEAVGRSREVMRYLEIESLADRPSYMLSGGEKKRVAIGSVLTMNPNVLLLDEPTNGLDPRTQSFVVELMIGLSEAGKTVIIATHDLSLVYELKAQVAVMGEDHRIAATGPASQILADEDLLLRANLIHEHRHIHEGSPEHAHRHSHFFFHRH